MEIHQPSSSRKDRKIVERNRRNHMKTLCSELNSLIPNQNSKKSMLQTDQLDEATNYIKGILEKLERMKEKKEHLAGIEKLQIDIHEMGSAFVVNLISGIHNQSMFYELIRVVQEEGAEIINASFSAVNNTFVHTIHSQVGESSLGSEAASRITWRLNTLVHEFQ
ncbi:transcription factor bHLH162-like [Macadamia integrifolia]|uniref:transcription factor bHLH162-like n=1 Tax=Macadamia integrifolia TaxID=60698 RepID=UPI001C4E8CA7|nr:transcription factor bHLH162-like [Macadamia integrifolia]XP_042484609.1 transcription factor bHLH162-like [Macadamia integrifolia]XP_042484610.1 transcription factor bHLH162-like [Macadamia integrifolia]